MPNVTGSITAQKKRYNNDFGTYFNGVNKIIFIDYNFQEINNNSDWSISFFINREVNNINTSGLIFDGRPIISGDEGGLFIFANDFGINNYKLNIGNGFSAPTTTTTIFDYEFNFNSLYHIVLSYNVTSNEITLFVNGVIEGDVNISNRILTPSNSTYSTIGGLNVPTGVNYFAHKGIIRDFATFNKELTQAEINYIYTTGNLSNSTYESCQFHIPLNQTPQQQNNIVRNTLIEESTNESKLLFDLTPSNNDSIKVEVLNAVGNAGSVGFKTQNTSIFDNDYYIIFIFNGVYGYDKNGTFVFTTINASIGDVMEAVINGTNVDVKVNGNLINSFSITGSGGVSGLIPFVSSRQPRIASLTNVTWNNVIINRTDILSNFNSTYGDLGKDITNIYNFAKTTNLSSKNICYMNWDDDELGLNTGTSTFTAYADFYTNVLGQNFSGGGDAITYKGEELRYYGLQFDSASGHNLTIQGLNTAKTNGYTFLVAVANKTNAAWASGQANIFSHVGTEGSSRQFEIEGSASNTGKALRIVFPSGSSTAGLDSYADNDFDNSKIQFASFALSPNQDYYLTYLRSSQTRGYGQASFNTNVNQANSVNTSFPLSFGFNEITNAVTKIGYNGTNSLDGILCYFAIVEGLEDQATIKRQFNNGLLSNPSDFERLGLNLAFFADLNNPFDDAGTIKIPDLGDNNLTVIADSDLDSTWSTLAGVQSSQVELKTLL